MAALIAAPMRVLITADAVGGVWRYALDVAGALNRRGIEAEIAGLGPMPTPAQRREAEEAGVVLHWLDAPLDWMAAGPAGVESAAAVLDRLLAEWQPTVLHLNAPPLATHLSAACPTVTAAHSCVSTWWRAVRGEPLPAEWGWHRQVTAKGFAAADAVVAPSRAFAAALAGVYGPLPHLHVVWNGSAGIGPERKRPFVLGAGRWWDESKNLGLLDKVAPDCRWPIRLAGSLAGPNGTMASAANVELLGELPHAEARRHLAEAAIFVSPSIYEPFGLAVLEAASAGAALVLSDIPTFRELWGGCARFAAPDDPGAFVRGINRLAEDDAQRARLAAAASVRAGRYRPDAQVTELLSVYAAAAAARRSRERGAA